MCNFVRAIHLLPKDLPICRTKPPTFIVQILSWGLSLFLYFTIPNPLIYEGHLSFMKINNRKTATNLCGILRPYSICGTVEILLCRGTVYPGWLSYGSHHALPAQTHNNIIKRPALFRLDLRGTLSLVASSGLLPEFASDKKRRRPTLPHLRAVPSARPGLTALFGMGRGGSPGL